METGISRRPHNFILTVQPVMAQFGDPSVKPVLGFHLQMIDVLFRVKVYPPSFLFNRHDRQSDIYAPVHFSFLDIKWRLGILQHSIIQDKKALVPAL